MACEKRVTYLLYNNKMTSISQHDGNNSDRLQQKTQEEKQGKEKEEFPSYIYQIYSFFFV